MFLLLLLPFENLCVTTKRVVLTSLRAHSFKIVTVFWVCDLANLSQPFLNGRNLMESIKSAKLELYEH